MDIEKMMQSIPSSYIQEQKLENVAVNAAQEIVAIDMTTPEYTADTCPMAAQSSDISTMPSVLERDL